MSKPLSRRAWTLIAIAAVFALILGGYFWLTRPKAGPTYTTWGKEELSKGDQKDLVKIVLTGRPEGTLTLVKKGDTWVTDPPRAVALDSSNMDDLAYSFTALFAERTIDDNPTDLGQYGLNPPRATAVGTFADGSVHTLYLGDKTEAGTTYYLQVKGNPKVYSVWMNNGQHFHWTVNDIRSKTIVPAINYDEVTSLRIVQRAGSVIEVKEKTPDESKSFQLGFGKFLMTRPYAYLRGLDSKKQDAFVKGPQAITIEGFGEDNPTDLSKYGLAKPWGEALVRDKTNSVDFLFGGDAGSSMTWYMIKGQPTVYKTNTSSLSFMDSKAFDLVDKFTFIPNIDDVDRVDITANGATHALVITRVTKKAAKAGDPDTVEATYTADGKTMDETNFKHFYQVVIGLQVEGEVQKTVADRPEISVVYTLNKGTSRRVRVDYAPYDRDFDAIFIDGVNQFALTKGQLTVMQEKLDLLLKGQTVDVQ
jgi:hypothetical protein